MFTKVLIFGALAGQGLSFHKLYFFHFGFLLSLSTIYKNMRKIIESEKILIFLGTFPLVSLLWTDNLISGFKDVIFISISFLTVLLIKYSDQKLQNFFFSFKIVCWINLFVSLFESLSILRFPLSQYSEYAHLFGKIYYSADPAGGTTPTGLHYNPNNNAFFILITFPILFGISRNWVAGAYFLISTFVIYMATSKLVSIAWLFSVIILFAILILQNRNKRLFFIPIILGLFFLAIPRLGSNQMRTEKYLKTIPALAIFIVKSAENFRDRWKGDDVRIDFRSLDYSLHERLTYIDGLVQILRKNFILGSGAGSLANKDNTQAEITVSLETPHFFFLELLTKFGVLYLLVWILWISNLFYRTNKISSKFALSILLIFIFNPVLPSLNYFLPAWAVLGLCEKRSFENLTE